MFCGWFLLVCWGFCFGFFSSLSYFREILTLLEGSLTEPKRPINEMCRMCESFQSRMCMYGSPCLESVPLGTMSIQFLKLLEAPPVLAIDICCSCWLCGEWTSPQRCWFGCACFRKVIEQLSGRNSFRSQPAWPTVEPVTERWKAFSRAINPLTHQVPLTGFPLEFPPDNCVCDYL